MQNNSYYRGWVNPYDNTMTQIHQSEMDLITQSMQRSQMYGTMLPLGASIVDLQEARGARLIKRGRATIKFPMRTPPLALWMKGWGGNDPQKRKKSYLEWLAQSALWRQEAKARGAQFGDMGDMMGLSFALCYEAYTGKKINNAGFGYLSKAFRDALLKDANYQGYTVTKKQGRYEDSMLNATYALYLRREGARRGDAAMIAKAREKAQKFMDLWWKEDTPGAVKDLARFAGKAAPVQRVAAASASIKSVKVPAAPRTSAGTTPAISFEQAVQATSFRPVATSVLPEQMAAGEAPAKRKAARKLFEAMVASGRNDLRKIYGGEPDDVAQGMSFLVVTYYGLGLTTPGQPANVSANREQMMALKKQFALALAGNPDFRNIPARRKQQMFETMLLLPLMTGYIYTQGQQSNNLEMQQKAREAARNVLQSLFGVPPEKMHFTAAGLQF